MVEHSTNASRDPTPEQIADACLTIQRGWSDVERIARLRVGASDRRLSDVDIERGILAERLGKERLAERGAC